MRFDGDWMAIEEMVADILDRRGVTPTKLGGEFTDYGHRVISAKLMKGGRLDLNADEPRFVERHIYEKWMRAPLRRGDVLMTSEAPLGELAYMAEGADWCLGQRLFALRPNPDLVDGRFLFYALQTAEVRADINGRASGTTVLGIRQAELRKVQVPVPPLKEQTSVAGFLGAIDDRIDNLRQTNTTLEAIAQALFKSWFVDFDPVQAKAEGREPEAMDAATAALFPSEFEESELGLIPKGWRIARLSDLVELAYGKALKASDRVAGEVPVYGSGGITGWHDAALVKCPTIIVGRKGSVGTIYWEDRPCHPIDTVFFVRPKEAPLTLCLQVLRSLGLDKMNTDAAVPGLNRENAYRLEVVVAPAAVNDAWHKLIEPIYAATSSNSRRYEALSKLRDTLLPRLISGKLRLPDAERAIEAAV